MFLFIRKILCLINIYSKLPDDYINFKFFRSFIKAVGSRNDYLYYLNAPFLTSIEQKAKKYEGDNNILFVTHEFSRTGAPKVALETLKAIKKIYGIKPIVIGIRDGEMRQDFIDEGFETHLVDFLPKQKGEFQKFCNQFKLIFVSSVANEFLYYINFLSTPVVWYSHEIFKKKADIEQLSFFIHDFKKILCGSPLTKKSIDLVDNKLNTELLIYGIKEETLPSIAKKEDKITFLCPASVEDRKNQKTLIEALNNLPSEIKDKIKVYMIGSALINNIDSEKYYDEVLELAKNIKEVEFLPNLSLDELFKYYAAADCIICPSKQDPMPVVVTYAFMFKKLALISNTIGQALLVEDNKNAVLFNPNNQNQLKEKIIDIVQNKEKYSLIAENGRKIYDDYFSLETFEKNLKNNLDEYILWKKH